KRTTMAPTTAPMSPAPSPGAYHPRAWPRKLATNAPTMPRIVVNTKPLGSLVLPGMMNLAITPATNPMTIVQMIPMACSYDGLGDDRAGTGRYTPTVVAGNYHVGAGACAMAPMRCI